MFFITYTVLDVWPPAGLIPQEVILFTTSGNWRVLVENTVSAKNQILYYVILYCVPLARRTFSDKIVFFFNFATYSAFYKDSSIYDFEFSLPTTIHLLLLPDWL